MGLRRLVRAHFVRVVCVRDGRRGNGRVRVICGAAPAPEEEGDEAEDEKAADDSAYYPADCAAGEARGAV